MSKANTIVSALINGQKELSFKDLEQHDFRIISQSEKKAVIESENKVFTIEVRTFDLKKKIASLLINDKPIEVKLNSQLDEMIEKMGLNVKKAVNLSELNAPMPGLVIDILVEVGQDVKEGDQLLILEAMKMENVIKATGEATVKSIEVAKADKVDKGQLLISFE